MNNTVRSLLLIATLSGFSAVYAEKADHDYANMFAKANAQSEEKLLAVVGQAISEDEGQICKIIQEAIVASEATEELVVDVVEAALEAHPEKHRLITECAVAVAPDSKAAIESASKQYVTATDVDPSYSDAKSADVEYSDAKGGVSNQETGDPPVIPNTTDINPLDFPQGGLLANPVGPTDGGPGGLFLLPFGPSFIAGNPSVNISDPSFDGPVDPSDPTVSVF